MKKEKTQKVKTTEDKKPNPNNPSCSQIEAGLAQTEWYFSIILVGHFVLEALTLIAVGDSTGLLRMFTAL